MKQLFILLTMISFTISQPHNDIGLKVNGISFNLDRLQFDFSIPNQDILGGSITIGLIKLGFVNLDLLHKEYVNSERSTFSFSGPNFILNNLDCNFQFDSYDPWVSLIRELNLSNYQTREVKDMMQTIDANCKSYDYSHGAYPNDVYELERNGYLVLPEKYNRKWKFDISKGNIIATSLSGYTDGPGKVIIYEPYYNSFRGYGEPDNSNTSQHKAVNDIKLHIGSIKLLFAAQGRFDLNNYNKLIEFQIDKAQFGISNSKVEMIYNDKPSSKIVFKLMDYHIDLQNISFDIDNSKDLPKIANFSGEIGLNNLEIIIPDEIYIQPGFQQYSKVLEMYSNIFRIRQVSIKVILKNGNNYKLDATLSSPFATVTINGDYHLYQTGNKSQEPYFDNLSIDVRNLSQGLTEMVNQWEEKNNQLIPRKSGSIFIELSGTPDNLEAKGFDLNKFKF